MTDAQLLQTAINIAVQAHDGQVDKAGKPYILHPMRVMLRGETPEEMMLGILHDVIEDTDVSLDEIRSYGFSDEVCHSLSLLTHDRSVPYDDYIRLVGTDALATRVKLYDLHDNMNRDRLKKITPEDEERMAKYKRSEEYLKSLSF